MTNFRQFKWWDTPARLATLKLSKISSEEQHLQPVATCPA